jgi:hypothetical protein
MVFNTGSRCWYARINVFFQFSFNGYGEMWMRKPERPPLAARL